jgi:hypothetical protein
MGEIAEHAYFITNVHDNHIFGDTQAWTKSFPERGDISEECLK